MHLIVCPFCGPRAQIEFRYHSDGEALPGTWEAETEEQLHRRLLYRTNDIGFHVELWHHDYGCGSWLRVERHNRTHEIRSTEYLSAGTSGADR